MERILGMHSNLKVISKATILSVSNYEPVFAAAYPEEDAPDVKEQIIKLKSFIEAQSKAHSLN